MGGALQIKGSSYSYSVEYSALHNQTAQIAASVVLLNKAAIITEQ